MKTKYNNKSEYFKDWTTKKLIEEFNSAYCAVYIVECSGTSDMRMIYGTSKELEKRGYECRDTMPVWVKER